MITRIVVQNYRGFRHLDVALRPGVNIVVGDNDAGKTTLIEAVNLGLTGRLHGKPFIYELSPYLVNAVVAEQYLTALRDGHRPKPPELVIEVFFEDRPECADLKGTNNSVNEDLPGLRIAAALSPEFHELYEKFLDQDPSTIKLVPTEYYAVQWRDFSDNPVTNRTVPASTSIIDASAIRLQSGTDYYLQNIIEGNLNPAERVELARAYRSLRETFADASSIAAINSKLAGTHGHITDREFSLSIDVSQRTAWEGSLVPHLDDLPIQYVGKGEQNSVKMLLALSRGLDGTHVVLVEEPENHLSFASMNILIGKIAARCEGKQVVLTTHSSYVLNKLGLENLVLLHRDSATRITELPPDTVKYFKCLSGYDTLRLVLAKRVILVEGDSDELVVQRAYHDRHSRQAIADGVDIIDVDGLSAKRFLDIAVQLRRRVAVVTDNDGNFAKAEGRYSEYTGYDFVSVHVGAETHGNTLEPQLLAANSRDDLNTVFGKDYRTDEQLLTYMKGHKTACALAIFESDMTITMPEYIRDAVA